MSTSDTENRESDGEELVAYLDGELPPDVSRRIEDRLASDADYRQQLRELDQAWEALDVLPRTTVGDDFARTTIEMVANIAAQQELAERTAVVTQADRSRRFGWVLAGIAAAVVGFFAAGMIFPNSDRELLKDLPVIRQVDLLTQISDVQFLRELAERVPLEQLARDTKAVDTGRESLQTIRTASLNDRDQWVEQLTPEQKQELWAQNERFSKDLRTEEERDRVRRMADEIAVDKDADRLQKTLLAYGQWLASKPEYVKADLREMPSNKERIDWIAERVRLEGWQAARQLNDAEKEKLRAVIREITAEHQEAMLSQRRDWFREARRENSGEPLPPLQGNALELLTIDWALRNNDLSEATRNRLIAQLEPPTQEFLKSPEARRRRRDPLSQWIRDLLPLRRSHDTSELMRYFAEELSNEERARLASRPSAEFEAEVADIYDAKELGIGFWADEVGRRGSDGGRGRRGGGQRNDSSDSNQRDDGERGPGGRGRGNDGRRGENRSPDERSRAEEQNRRESEPSEEEAQPDDDRGNDNRRSGRNRGDNSAGPAAAAGPGPAIQGPNLSAPDVREMLENATRLLESIQKLLEQGSIENLVPQM